MSNLRDKVWLWGQMPGGHHACPNYNLPGVNKMTPMEGLEFFGIKNLCRVKLSRESDLSFFDDDLLLKNNEKMEKCCLSLIGAGEWKPKDKRDDLEDVLAMAKTEKRVCASVMDDFVSKERMKTFTPDVLKELREALHTRIDRPIELWSVLYERDFDDFSEAVKMRAKEFDVTTFWTWFGKNLVNLEENLKMIKEVNGDGRTMLGVYLYDYGDGKQLPDDLMRLQLDFAKKKLESGEIEGIILCSNCVADIGLTTVPIMLDWLNTL